MGRSQSAIFSMMSAASRGVERFSFPRADSSGWIIFLWSFVSAAPSEADRALMAGMPNSSISTFVAVLSECRII